MKILVVMKIEEEHKRILERAINGRAEISYIENSKVTMEQAQEADIIIGNINPSYIKGSTNLKLLQLNSAGTDGYTTKGVLPVEAVLTNATGSYGLAISEYMVGVLLEMMKKLDLYLMDQEKCIWSDHGSVRSIYGSTVLVVGLGDIGSEFAIRMKAMGAYVIGIRRNKVEKPEYVDEIYQMDKLNECLKRADIVAASLPGTSETYKIFNKETFDLMKDDSYFINVGRGNAVDTEALCDALENKKLAGAAVDVTDPEPLPSDNRLWKTRGAIITPHVSGGYHLKETHDRIIKIAANNIVHFFENEEYENIVDFNTGYRKFK